MSFVVKIFLVLFFTSCASDKIIYPSWYINPPQDTKNILYARGKASTQKEAIIYALEQISSKLNISIQSDFKSNTISSNSQYDKEVLSSIKSNTHLINFSHYRVIYNQIANDNVLVVVGVDKKILYKKYEKNIISLIGKANRIYKKYEKNIIKKLKSYSYAISLLDKVQNKVEVLNFLDKSSSNRKYLTKTNLLQKSLNKYINSIKIKISFDKNSEKLASELKSIIVNNSLRVVNNNEDIHIKIKTITTLKEVLSYKIAKSDIYFSSYDKHNILLAKNHIVTSGKSISNFTKAKAISIKIAKEKLNENKEFISKIIGINKKG